MVTIDFAAGADPESLAKAARHAEYMRAARANEMNMRDRRLTRLKAAEPGVREACKAYDAAVREPNRQALIEMVIRRPFILCDPPRPPHVGDPEDDGPAPKEDLATRPAMTRLVHRRGAAPAFYLTALWDAQASTAPGELHKATRPLIDHARGWDRLTGLRGFGLPTRDRQLRLQRVLTQLERNDLVRLPGRGVPGRYNDFKLLTDDRGDKRYRVPAHEPVIRLPAALITNGWHLVLEPTEIAFLLMLHAHAQILPTAHHGPDGVGIAPRMRWAVYGVTPEVYEVHNELWEFGLIDRVDSVRARKRGRVTPPAPGEDPLVTYGFKLKPDAFEQAAYDVVHTTLSREDGGRTATWPRPITPT